MKNSPQDEHFMELAILQAHKAVVCGEIPVGAVLVYQGEVIAAGHNLCVQQNDPTAHAEVVVLRAAAQVLNNYRLQDCELYVTLEPCAMCAAAVLHARIKRLVFGAPDPKAGAVGSVLNLMQLRQLNHNTQWQGGLKAPECAHHLQSFFKYKRQQQKKQSTPLREDALRTPDARFANLPDYPWQGEYRVLTTQMPGLRLHYLDIFPDKTPIGVVLCLHGASDWSYAFKNDIPRYLAQGWRVVAPDCIGFGKSDKPKRENVHTKDFHINNLMQLIQFLKLVSIRVVVQGWGAALAKSLQNIIPESFDLQAPIEESVCVPENMSNIEMYAAYEAPFPDAGHQAAIRALRTNA